MKRTQVIEENCFVLLRCVSIKKPKRGGKRQASLATKINRHIDAFLSDPLRPLETMSRENNTKNSQDKDTRAKLVANKLGNIDIKGCYRLTAEVAACSAWSG